MKLILQKIWIKISKVFALLERDQKKKKGPGTSGKYICLVLLRVKEIFHSN